MQKKIIINSVLLYCLVGSANALANPERDQIAADLNDLIRQSCAITADSTRAQINQYVPVSKIIENNLNILGLLKQKMAENDERNRLALSAFRQHAQVQSVLDNKYLQLQEMERAHPAELEKLRQEIAEKNNALNEQIQAQQRPLIQAQEMVRNVQQELSVEEQNESAIRELISQHERRINEINNTRRRTRALNLELREKNRVLALLSQRMALAQLTLQQAQQKLDQAQQSERAIAEQIQSLSAQIENNDARVVALIEQQTQQRSALAAEIERLDTLEERLTSAYSPHILALMHQAEATTPVVSHYSGISRHSVIDGGSGVIKLCQTGTFGFEVEMAPNIKVKRFAVCNNYNVSNNTINNEPEVIWYDQYGAPVDVVAALLGSEECRSSYVHLQNTLGQQPTVAPSDETPGSVIPQEEAEADFARDPSEEFLEQASVNAPQAESAEQ